MTKGERILLLRKRNHLSQTELDSMIGVKPQTVFKYESDDVTNIPSDRLELLAKALNTTPQYIMGWTDIQSDSNTLSQVTEQFLGQYFTPEELKDIEDYIFYIINKRVIKK